MVAMVLLPRTFLHRTQWDTAISYDRQLGIVRSTSEGWFRMTLDELRRGYPDAWDAWLRFAQHVPLAELPAASGDGARAAR